MFNANQKYVKWTILGIVIPWALVMYLVLK